MAGLCCNKGSVCSYQIKVVDNPSAELHHCDIVVQCGIVVVGVLVNSLDLDQLLELRIVTVCVDFDLGIHNTSSVPAEPRHSLTSLGLSGGELAKSS